MHLLRSFLIAFVSLVILPTNLIRAEVAVLANRAAREIAVQVSPAGERERTVSIPAESSRPVFFEHSASVRFGPLLAPQVYSLAHGAAYFFAFERDGQTLRMERIGLGPSDLKKPEPVHGQLVSRPGKSDVAVIPVTLAVDEDEPSHRTIWEPRLRQRVESASRILEQHCGVRLSVRTVVTWESDDKYRQFTLSMREFEREVPSEPGHLVIGFSSQYDFTPGLMHLGGSRGPLHSHILLKERAPNVREPEKLELLVHELCHHLGAAHSPEPTSVMRPILSVSQLRSTGKRIYIDPVNALLMALVADELRQGTVRNFADVSFPTKQRMLEIYKVLQEALPTDPAAGHFQQLVGQTNSPQLAMEVREILAQLTRFAKLQMARAEKGGIKISGDDLTSSYVREAAAIAEDMGSDYAVRAMILALGIFVDDSRTLRSFPATSSLVGRVETDEQFRERASFIGTPAMHGRADLAKHFFISGHLTVVLGGAGARSAGLVKEVLDSRGGSGFSFADMMANRAGIVFAEKLSTGEITLKEVAEGFSVSKFMPTVEDALEGLQAAELRDRITDPRSVLEDCDKRILALPVYRNSATEKTAR